MLPVLTDFSFPTNSPTWLSGVFYNVKPRGVELCGRYWTGKSARLCRKWTYQESYTCGEMHGWNELTTPNIDYSKSMKNWERLIIAWIYWKLCNHTAFHVLLLECAPRNAEETEDEARSSKSQQRTRSVENRRVAHTKIYLVFLNFGQTNGQSPKS